MDATDPNRPPGPDPTVAQADASAPGAPFGDSYWDSSLELRRGVEVQVVGIRAVAGELLRELARLHEIWRKTDRRAAPGVASSGGALSSSPAYKAVLDIAFEADGSITTPGELPSTDR